MSDCLFCAIARGTVTAAVIFSDDDAVVFRDINPVAPVHLLIIPKQHYATLAEAVDADPALASVLFATAAKVARDEGLGDSGYRTVVNTGINGGQTVGHVHLHVIGGRPMTWPPG